MLEFSVIVGSTRYGRRGRIIADWFIDHARRLEQAHWTLIDLAELCLPCIDFEYVAGTNSHPVEAVNKWKTLVGHSDGFVWVTPEYNHGYPAPLKNALDHVYDEWHRKPVAIVSYGGEAGGARAAEQLRLVACELHMAPIQAALLIPSIQQRLLDDPAAGLRDREDRVANLVNELVWWAATLKQGREHPLDWPTT